AGRYAPRAAADWHPADSHDGGRLRDRLALLHPPPRHPGRARAPARLALPVPAQQMVLRRTLRLYFRSPHHLAWPAAVERRRWLADRRLRAGRRIGARARRHPLRCACADRLSLPLWFWHADRGRRLYPLVHVFDGDTLNELAGPLSRHLSSSVRCVAGRAARAGKRATGARNRALDRAVGDTG